jgi:hypothetical protein
MTVACAPTTHERRDQQLVKLPVLSLIIYARLRVAEALGNDRIAYKQLKSLP